MRFKVEELTGKDLDLAVALAEGLVPERDGAITFLCKKDDPATIVIDLFKYDASINWWIAGPIIERERIGFWWSPANESYFAEKRHFGKHHKAGRSYGEGSTPLIAAMRCYVSLKLGDEINL